MDAAVGFGEVKEDDSLFFIIHSLFGVLAVANCCPLPHHPKTCHPQVSLLGHQEQ